MADPRVAYFSMEIALAPEMPTYSGGLGVLAEDFLRSAADAAAPIVAVTLAHREGYFRQTLDTEGNQREAPVSWRPEDSLRQIGHSMPIMIEGRRVLVRAWEYLVRGVSGAVIPVYLLDTKLPENSAWDQTLTDSLYGGDQRYRLCQEAVLGMGGVKILHRLGFQDLQSYHMNEGHAALLAIALLEQAVGDAQLRNATEQDLEQVRQRCVFTTHTPVPAGHDQFPLDLVRQVLGPDRTSILEVTHCCPDQTLNMTYLALRFSRYVNGVAMRHGEVSRDMFPQYQVRAITNGVHAATWAAPALAALFDRHIPEWRYDNDFLRYVIGVPADEITAAHKQSKLDLLAAIAKSMGQQLDPDALTIGFARRAATYKRADLLFTDLERLRQISERHGPLQILYAGKSHPHDEGGKEVIRRVFRASAALESPSIRILYVPDYDLTWGGLLTSGVDVWLNTPLPPLEASGTSGMKAALNGVPSLSVLDGWWVEGCLEGTTGWAIGERGSAPQDSAVESRSLYDKLDTAVASLFYREPEKYAAIRRAAIAINGSFFNTERMLQQYVDNAYRLRPSEESRRAASLVGLSEKRGPE